LKKVRNVDKWGRQNEKARNTLPAEWIRLKKRMSAIGLVFRYRAKLRVTAQGKDIPGAVVEAVPIDHPSPHAKSGLSVPQEDGSHLLMLDAGRYRLTAMVPFESGFAFAIKEIEIEESGDIAKKPVDVNLEPLEAPIPAVATVSFKSTETDVKGATVEWYEVVGENVDKAILVGRSTVDRHGNAVGLLPPLGEP
jgi:hypothetical protein